MDKDFVINAESFLTPSISKIKRSEICRHELFSRYCFTCQIQTFLLCLKEMKMNLSKDLLIFLFETEIKNNCKNYFLDFESCKSENFRMVFLGCNEAYRGFLWNINNLQNSTFLYKHNVERDFRNERINAITLAGKLHTECIFSQKEVTTFFVLAKIPDFGTPTYIIPIRDEKSFIKGYSINLFMEGIYQPQDENSHLGWMIRATDPFHQRCEDCWGMTFQKEKIEKITPCIAYWYYLKEK